MSGILKNSDKTKNNKNKNAFSPVPSADSFPWKKVGNDNSNLEELKSKIEPPKMEKKKETLYSAYDSFLDDKRNTFLSESSYNFDTLNRTSYIEEEYEPIVENQMAIITNEQPKPQRYSMLSALAPLTKRVSLDKPKLTQESQTQDSLRYSEEETSSVDYSYVSYESDYEAIDDNAQPIVQNQLDVKSEGPKGATTKSLEKKIEENIEKYKEEEVKVYESDSDSEIEEEDFSLRFQRDSVRDSKDIVAEAVAKKLKEVNEKEQKEKEKETEKEKEKEKEEKPKSKGQIEREKAAKEAKAIEALKPSYVEQTNIKPTINELTPQMVVDAEKDASKTADESITNIKPQFVKNATIQPNVASLTSSMIKPPTQSIYLSSKEISNLSLGDVTNDNILADLDSPKLDEKKGKGKGRSDSDEEFYKTQEGLKGMSLDEESKPKDINTPEVSKPEVSKPEVSKPDVNKPLLTAPQIEPPKNMIPQQQIPSFLASGPEQEIKVLEHPNPLIYSGYLEKLSTHGRFQRRLFRFDGLILTCLSQNKQKVPVNSNLLNFQPIFLKDGTQESVEIVNSLGKFYPNEPVLPEIVNPLVAVEKNISPSGVPDLKAHQYYYPKWMLNIQEIESIQPLLSIQINGRPNNDIAGILRANNQDQNELTFIITTKTISYILRAPNNRDFNRWMYILNRMKETYIELEDEMNNPKPHIERPRFKGFPPPPNNPPPPELQAKRYRNCQEYVKNNLGFSLSIPQNAFMEVNRPLVVQVCMDIRDKFYRRIALLKIWNICFTDLLSIDTNVSHNAVIIPVNKAIMAKDGPSVPPMGDPSGPSGPNGPGGPGGPMGMPMSNMPMGMGGMPEGMPHGMNNMGMPQGLMSPSMGIKSGTKNDLGIPIATPGLGSPNMKGMNGPNGPMSPTMVPGMGAPMGVPGLMSPPMAPSGMGGVPMGLMSPKVNGNGPMGPKINGNGPMGLMSPKVNGNGPMGLMSPQVNGNGPMGLMSPQVNGNGPMGLMSPKVNGNGPMMGGNMMKGTPMMDEMKPGMSPMVNGINRKDSVGSSVIEPNIKELMNYGKNDDDDSDDEFYLPKKEDGSLKPFIGRNSVIGNTNSLLHFKKLSLMDVGGDFNSLYRALNNENAHNNQIPKQKSQKQGSTDHFAQELEMLDNMNTKSSQQANMNKMGINTRQVNMTNIVPGVSKTTSMIQPNDESMMTEDISVDFPAPPNPYGQTTLGILNSRNDRNMQEQNMGNMGNMGMMPAQAPVPAEKIHIPVDPELLHCLTAMLRIIHRLSGSCFREEQKSFESVPPPVPKWYYQFCVKSFPSFAKLSQTHVINYLECMEEQYAINGHQELPQEYLKIQEALESFIKATRAWERVVNDWKRDIIHRKHLNHKKINFDDDDSIMKVVRINDVLRVNLLLKDHIEENARRETSKLRKFFQPPQRKSIEKNK